MWSMTPYRRRQTVPVETALSAAPGRRLVSPAIIIIGIALAVLSGIAIGEGYVELPLLAAAGLLGLAAFRYLGFSGWCFLLLSTAILARGLRTAAGLPTLVDFIHYPIVLAFALAAADRPRRAEARGPGNWLIGFLIVVSLSALAHPSHPLRAVLFILIAGEPLLVIWAIARWGPDTPSLRRTAAFATAIALVQLPIGTYQGLRYGWTDPVQGTLAGHGAGSHILGGLFALGLFVVLAAILSKRIGVTVGAAAALACLAMTIATGSMAVLILAVASMAVGAIFGGLNRPEQNISRRAGTVVVTFVLGTGALAFVAAWVPGIYERAEDLATRGERPELAVMKERARTDPFALLIGSGPGTSASRASLLLTGPKEGSPLEFVGLEPTEAGREISEEVFASNEASGGSAESDPSGSFAIVGDLGVIGLIAFGLLILRIWQRAGRSRSWLAPAARSAILMSASLSFVDNWLEYPEFAIPLAILLGVVVSDERPSAKQPV
jgi:hypothetical protein